MVTSHHFYEMIVEPYKKRRYRYISFVSPVWYTLLRHPDRPIYTTHLLVDATFLEGQDLEVIAPCLTLFTNLKKLEMFGSVRPIFSRLTCQLDSLWLTMADAEYVMT